MSAGSYGLSPKPTDPFLSMFDKKAEVSTSYTHDLATLTIPKVELYSSIPSNKLSYKTDDIFAVNPSGYTSSHWSSLPSTPIKVSNHTNFEVYKSPTPSSNFGSGHFDHKDLNSILAGINTSTDNFSKYISLGNLADDKKIRSIGSLGNVDSKTDLLSVSRTLQSEHKYGIKDSVTIFDFLSKIKATDHTKMNDLFLLSSQYSQARIFSGSQQGIYLTLSFSFYEKLLLNDPKTSERVDFSPVLQRVFDKNTEKIVSKLAYKNFIVDLKRFLLEKEASQGIALHNSICNYSETYEASLIFFREVLIENLKSYSTQVRNSLQEIDGSAFKWIHDLQLYETTFYQEVTEILKTSLKVMVLTATGFEQKTFLYSSIYGLSSKESTETVLFLDKRDGICYILYINKDQAKSSSPTIDISALLTTTSPQKKTGYTKRGGSHTPNGYSSGSTISFDISTNTKISKESIDALLYAKTTTTSTSTETFGTKSNDIYGLKSSTTLLDTVMKNQSLTPKPVDSVKVTELLKLSIDPPKDPYGIGHLLPKTEEKSSLDVQALLGKSGKDYETSPAASPSIMKTLGVGASFGEGISPLAKHDMLFAADPILNGKSGTFTEVYKEKSINSMVDQLLNDKSMASIAELLKDKTSKSTSHEKIETSVGVADLLLKDKKQDLTVAQLLGEYPVTPTKRVDLTVEQLLNEKPISTSSGDKDITVKVDQLLKDVGTKYTIDDILIGKSTSAIDPLIGLSPTDKPHSLTVDALLKELNVTPKAEQTSSSAAGYPFMRENSVSPIFDRIYNETSTTLFTGFTVEKVPTTDIQIQNPLVDQLLNNERTSTPIASLTQNNITTEAFDLALKEKIINPSVGLLTSDINLLLNKISSAGSGSAGHRSSSSSHKGSDHLVDLVLNEKSITPVSDNGAIEKNTIQITNILATNHQSVSILDLSPANKDYVNALAEQIIREFTPKSDYMKTSLKIRTLPNALKEQFKGSGKEVESHEHEFNKISQRFLEDMKNKQKDPPSALVTVVTKYKAIMNSKKK